MIMEIARRSGAHAVRCFGNAQADCLRLSLILAVSRFGAMFTRTLSLFDTLVSPTSTHNTASRTHAVCQQCPPSKFVGVSYTLRAIEIEYERIQLRSKLVQILLCTNWGNSRFAKSAVSTFVHVSQ